MKNPAIGRQALTDNNSRGDRAVALITVIIILFFVALLGSAVIGMVVSRVSQMSLETDSLKAQYVAEAGISKAQYEMSKGNDPAGDGIGNIPPTAFGEGAYMVIHDPQAKTLTAIGVVHDTKKVVFIKYAAI
ncbi:MAG: hypothetical protein AUJ89_05495 [Candidatus Omnitrophica bacterium CG1_02_43_210]|nr:MAG: hypothetical protein AUJ89_05495 [Candidatus Omnitrophica bacterium CG1_02_43_210]PIV38931.1 MAG: hypothetical protein COS29_05285 [Candidatus Omnitrophica bacterium CG02_land_8_20_14_3_00__42_8]